MVGCHIRMPPPTARDATSVFSPGSAITFYWNGISQGTAFSPLYKGIYFPAVSLYMGAVVTVNFGAEPWWAPPQSLIAFARFSELPPVVDALQSAQGVWVTDRVATS